MLPSAEQIGEAIKTALLTRRKAIKAEKGKQKVRDDSTIPVSKSGPPTPSEAYGVLGTPLSEPKLFRFNTFTKGKNFVTPFNYWSFIESNETMFVTFTATAKSLWNLWLSRRIL